MGHNCRKGGEEEGEQDQAGGNETEWGMKVHSVCGKQCVTGVVNRRSQVRREGWMGHKIMGW